MKIILDTAVSDLLIDFVPTSVYINSVQTFAYTMVGTNIFFDTTQEAGTEITAIPDSALRFIDHSIETLNITETGWYSLLSEPFGAVEFSLDNATWFKSLSTTFPATVYCRLTSKGVVLDLRCRADIELILWKGPDFAKINELGNVELFKELPSGSYIGGADYYVH